MPDQAEAEGSAVPCPEQAASGAFQIQFEGGPSYVQSGADTVLRAALRAGMGFPYECNSGGCGSCKFDLVEGSVTQLWPEAPGLTERDRRKNKLLACQVRANSNLTIKMRCRDEYRAVATPVRQAALLVQVVNVTHDIREFRFKAETESAPFLPGQYAMLQLSGIDSPRAYSMSNTGNDRGEWHFQIRRVPNGKATAQLFGDLRVGEHIELDGPYGLAYLRQDSARDILCIAGGSGLAPMVSIARGAAESGMLGTRRLHFFYGGRTPRDICGESFLRALGGFGDRIHFHPVVSAPDPSQSWGGRVGFVHDQVREAFGADLPRFEVYFAGPPPMTQSISDMLIVDNKVPFDQVHFDRFY